MAVWRSWTLPALVALLALPVVVGACSGGKSSTPAASQRGPTSKAQTAGTAAADLATAPTLIWAKDGSPDPLSRPGGIAIDSKGNIFVCDCGNARIVKLDADGKVVAAWGSQGTSQGQFMFSRGGRFGAAGAVAVDADGDVYVGDLSGRIQIFDGDGHFLRSIENQGGSSGRPRIPSGIAVDAQGNIYVADSGASDVEKFDSAGKLLVRWGMSGSGSGQFGGAVGIAIDTFGNVYVGDRRGARIEKFDEDGNFLYEFRTALTKGGPSLDVGGLAIDQADDIYVTGGSENQVIKYDRFGGVLASWNGVGAGSSNGQFAQPGGVATDSSGNVYLVDSRGGRIEKFGCPAGGC